MRTFEENLAESLLIAMTIKRVVAVPLSLLRNYYGKSKAIPVTGREGP
jgi:hypothetical protein